MGYGFSSDVSRGKATFLVALWRGAVHHRLIWHVVIMPFSGGAQHSSCHEIIAPFPRKAKKWSLLFPEDISSCELPGEAKRSACPAEAKSICTTNAYSFPWSGSNISLLPPTKLNLNAGFSSAFTLMQVLQPQSKIFKGNTKENSTIAQSLNKTRPRLIHIVIFFILLKYGEVAFVGYSDKKW